jgi:hypothetical protein
MLCSVSQVELRTSRNAGLFNITLRILVLQGKFVKIQIIFYH